jgi:hypothetical protein
MIDIGLGPGDRCRPLQAKLSPLERLRYKFRRTLVAGLIAKLRVVGGGTKSSWLTPWRL